MAGSSELPCHLIPPLVVAGQVVAGLLGPGGWLDWRAASRASRLTGTCSGTVISSATDHPPKRTAKLPGQAPAALAMSVQHTGDAQTHRVG